LEIKEIQTREDAERKIQRMEGEYKKALEGNLVLSFSPLRFPRCGIWSKGS
jgi:hypothetical protein